MKWEGKFLKVEERLDLVHGNQQLPKAAVGSLWCWAIGDQLIAVRSSHEFAAYAFHRKGWSCVVSACCCASGVKVSQNNTTVYEQWPGDEMLCFLCVEGSEAFNWKSLATLYLGRGAGNLTVGFRCQMCAFCYFWGEKKKEGNISLSKLWSYPALQILSKDLLEHRCPILQSGFLPNVLTPQIPGGEFCSPTSLGLGDKSKNSFFLCPSRRAIPNAATALSFLLGPQDWAHPTRTGQGARVALSSHPSQHDKASSTLGIGVCFNHSLSHVPDLLAMLLLQSLLLWVLDFLYFQFLNYIDYHIKHSWYYRQKLKIISLYLPNTNETHLYY